MSGPNLNQILSNTGFTKSIFFPTNTPLMGDSEFKNYITEMYNLYTNILTKQVFSTTNLSKRIFSFVDAPNNLANFYMVDKLWKNNVIEFTKDKWKQLIKAKKDLPWLWGQANRIEQQFPKKSCLLKFGILSKRVGEVLENQSIHLENLKKCEKKYEKQLDFATKAMWGRLRPKLHQLGIRFLPVSLSTPKLIRNFLNKCERLSEIKELDLSNLQLKVAPPELNLLIGLKKVCFDNNQLPDLSDLMNVIENNDLNFFNSLSNEVIQKMTDQFPKSFLRVSKHIYRNVCDGLYSQWKLLKDSNEIPSRFREELIEIEKNLKTQNGFHLIREFFRILNPIGGKPRIDFSKLDIEMLEAFVAEHDLSLSSFWSCIKKSLNIQNGPENATEIRIWMADENNQKRLAQIEKLDLSNLSLRIVPREIIYFSGLTELRLSDNFLVHLPDAIGNLTKLQMLYFGNNQITQLPDAIGNLTKLTQLSCSCNQITQLPDTIGNLTMLTELYCTNNKITQLPDTIGNLTKLTVLYCTNNKITQLPDAIGRCKLMEMLNLENNNLTEFPASITGWNSLKRLYLANNKLRYLPSSLININNIDIIKLDFSENRLLIIPKLFLERFEGYPVIRLFIQLRDMKPQTILQKVSQLIRLGSDEIISNKFEKKELLGQFVDQLDPTYKEQLYYRIWQEACNKNDVDAICWGEQNRFKDMFLFTRVLGELLDEYGEVGVF